MTRHRYKFYEMVPVDVNGVFTNVLERGHVAIKDNRLVPQGFSTSDPAYDTTQIIGSALTDPDFNKLPDGTEGSGADVLHFSIENKGYTGFLTVSAKVWYQSLPPKWMAPMFEWSAPEIDSFKTMFEAADRTPILVAEQVLQDIFVTPVATKSKDIDAFVSISPSVTQDGWIFIKPMGNGSVHGIEVWNTNGQSVLKTTNSTAVLLPDQKGFYLISVNTNRGRMVKKVLRT
ncbi:MAG: hypothetical protein RIQ78_57 [Bacteroidota bacterium]